MIKKYFKTLSFIVIALMIIAVYTTTVAAKPEFKPYIAEKGSYDGGDIDYELLQNESHLFMKMRLMIEREKTLYRLFNLNTGEVINYKPNKDVKDHKYTLSQEIIDSHRLTSISPINGMFYVRNPMIFELNNHELVFHQLGSCSPISPSYSFKGKDNNNSVKKSLVVTGELVFNDWCDIISEWGPTPVVSRSLKVRHVWALPDELYVVAFRNHPAILYIDNSKSFDNPFNEGANFTIVDHQVIENILNDEKLEQSSDRKRFSLPKPLTDKTQKELLTLLKPAYTAQALKEYLESNKQNNKDK